MSESKTHWGSSGRNRAEGDRQHFRKFITGELPETRIFVSKLYRDFLAARRRTMIAKSVQRKQNPN